MRLDPGVARRHDHSERQDGQRAAAVGFAAALALLALISSTSAKAQEDCLDCHDEAEAVAASAHEFLDCTDCHPSAAEPHDEGLPEGVSPFDEECESCHDEAVIGFVDGVHGDASRLEGETWLDGCVGCHGSIHTLVLSSAPESPVHASNIATTCGTCHADPAKAELYRLRATQPLEAYLGSVHAQAVGEELNGATCGGCHGNHLVLPAADPRSKVHHQRVTETCGQCHDEIAATYRESIHGQAAEIGIRESPVCTDCHGEHKILSSSKKDSPVYASNIPKMTCGRCHGDLRLTEKYGISADSVPAYEDSYHGLVARAGAVGMAQCASCHGVHDILPSSDPSSHINSANLGETCGQCHPGAGSAFGIGPVHVLPSQPEHRAVYLIRAVYLWLIFLTIGGMLLHNGLDFLRKVKHRPAPVAASSVAGVERMDLGFRVAHGLLASSFIVLAYTGFALKYPEAWWATPLLQWEDTIGFRGLLHRTAALVMLAACALHVVHLARHRRARACISSMRPTLADWREFRDRAGYLLGLRSEPPRPQWLEYGEKVEYLAVVWGTIVMTVTGFALWFEVAVLRWLPSWIADVATVVHFYEAVLAGLAILVWHFYAVIFDPVVYPMDTAWLTGQSAPGRAAERPSPPTYRSAARRSTDAES